MDALYFRVSSDRQTTENQFEDLLQIAEKDDSVRDWNQIRQLLSQAVYQEEVSSSRDGSRPTYRIRPEVVAELARYRVYVEQGRSGKAGARRRPLFEQMKQDAVQRKFARLLVWKVSRLGRDMPEVIATVYELADLGVTVVPVKSQTGPISSTMGKLLWAIQAWFAEMENSERSEAIQAGQARARAAGKKIGRPRAIFRRDLVAELRRQGFSWRRIARELNAGVGTVRRAYLLNSGSTAACQNCVAEVLQVLPSPNDLANCPEAQSNEARLSWQHAERGPNRPRGQPLQGCELPKLSSLFSVG
jgi:putative DNA-invertase from lambdoid prophage Rac